MDMKSISDYSSLIETAIAGSIYSSLKPASLYEPIAYGLQKGGKRLRPVILLITAEAFGTPAPQAMPQALGIEMFHNFTLLHDDVMDRSSLRRGRPTVCAKWDDNTATLSGDTMLTLATRLISQTPDQRLRSVLDIFNTMAIEVYEGQRLDMDFEERENVSISEYIEMIGKKTGALLGASARIGAVIAGAPETDAALMYDFGMELGLAFQIQDDLLDTFGDPATFGKPIGGDILNNKKTFLTTSLMEKCDADAGALADAMKMPASELKIRVVKGIYEKAGIPAECRKDIAAHSKKALKALRSTSLPEADRRLLEHLVEKLIDRSR